MKMPGINISFIEKSGTAIQRGERGIVALILRGDSTGISPYEITDASGIPPEMDAWNRKQVLNVFRGYVTAPKKVIIYMLRTDAEDYADAMNALEKEEWDYLAAPRCMTDGVTEELAAWIGAMRGENRMVKAVLPESASNREYIINYATESVTDAEGNVYTAEEYCGRIAGIIAGTPMTISCTYAPLPELTDCTRLKREDMEKAATAGKLIVFHDGEKVKILRGVTSLSTETEKKGRQFRKIKIVEAMDIITNDIRRTVEDSYIGKYANSYDNKCVLISAIGNYFAGLIRDGVLSEADVGIDTVANREYLESTGVKTEDIPEEELKQASTGDRVFLRAAVKILDAIEEVELPIEI